MPDFEVLDARIASALNKIIHDSHFKRKVSLEEQKAQKRRPFPSRKTDRANDSVQKNAALFTIGLQNGHSPEESWTCLTQIEDDGEKKCRAEFANEDFF